MFVTHQSSIRKHISHQGGKTAICTVMACTYTFQLALTRCQKFAKSLPFGVFSLQIASFIGSCQRFMGFSMNGKFASGAVEQDEARKNEDEWLRSILSCYFYVISILLLTRNNQGFYFLQYLCAPFDQENQLVWCCVFVTRPKEPFCRNMVPNASGS